MLPDPVITCGRHGGTVRLQDRKHRNGKAHERSPDASARCPVWKG